MNNAHNMARLVPIDIIMRAVQGDPSAIEAVIFDYCQPMINKAASRTIHTDGGYCYKRVDPDWKQRIEIRLAAAIPKFRGLNELDKQT